MFYKTKIYLWTLNVLNPFFGVSKYLLKIKFICSVLFLIILYICTIIF